MDVFAVLKSQESARGAAVRLSQNFFLGGMRMQRKAKAPCSGWVLSYLRVSRL